MHLRLHSIGAGLTFFPRLLPHYTAAMTDFMIWKLIALVALAFLWGLYCGITGRPTGRERSDKPAERPDQTTIDAPPVALLKAPEKSDS